ncbi:MAG TPA: hypothetical protein VN608_05555 [Clostridia bacterium]|nr:hypothetical protein [Clostridia bacterium]
MPDLLKCGAERKFIVLPLKYLERLSPYEKADVANVENRIARLRRHEKKDPWPEYIVINTDEPYASEVIEIMKKHGHWGMAKGRQND